MTALPHGLRRIEEHLRFLYSSKIDDDYVQRFLRLVAHHVRPDASATNKWNETDVILITYGDSIRRRGEKPLRTLDAFLRRRLSDVTCVHILPFFPYSSDDGFSVIDYEQVDPQLGTWDDVKKINEKFDLQIDLVINHVSQRSRWFRNYLQGKSPGAGYFIEVDPDADLSRVVHPRSLPLLTKFDTVSGPRWLWTTFSADQIDLNFANPEVLYEMTRILLFYIKMGARIIRLDAIAFLWKEIGTSCLHLPQTHRVVKLFRTIFDLVDPRLILLTETNVPNEENLSYFGDNDEANMVYQFSLPPLLLHALHTGSSEHLTAWAQTLPALPSENTFFNFTASHDGIGVRPLEGLLSTSEIDRLCRGMQNFGGRIGAKANPDGTTSPYEINISLFDAFKGDVHGVDEFQVPRFLCSQTIMMALQGIPAFYIHSLLATPNDREAVERTGSNRAINRHKWDADELYPLLDGDTTPARVFTELRRLIKIRKKQPAFHPNAGQEILAISDSVFAVRRYIDDALLLSVSNMTKQRRKIDLSRYFPSESVIDLIEDKAAPPSSLSLAPYQTLWLTPHTG